MIFGRKKKNGTSELDSFLKEASSSSSLKHASSSSSAPTFQAEMPAVTKAPEIPKFAEAPKIPDAPKAPDTVQVPAPNNFSLKKTDSIGTQKSSFIKRSEFHNPEILDLDLIKQESEGRINWSRYLNLTIASLLMLGVVVAQAYFIIVWWESSSSKTKNITSETAKIKQQIKDSQQAADEASAFKKRADLILPMLNNHIYWTNFFRYLERNTLSSVTFTGFSGDTMGNYSLSATANHYSDINWQVKEFLADDYTISATVGSGNSGGENIISKLGSPIATGTEQARLEEAKALAEEKRLKAAGPKSVSFSIAIKVKPDVFHLK